ncbi:Mov34/MPN/PAD-1 family protein [Telmatospirillum sp. J64-1]|uniref:Mov34/MPN/PAD-1 family protein n=1 Tax=Telmatospirillum sp. J64-1 TaxID=2502183 RepID=UPI00115D14E2|nr:M67 family metallopeptidase [Telmatospirillum sp. J64-1]
MILRLSPDHLRLIAAEAEAAWPHECCGLLVGRHDGAGEAVVTRVEPAANLMAHTRDRFELDPAVHIRLLRELRGTELSIIGHYHSHPDAPAEPSAEDLARANDPDLIWLIVPVAQGRAGTPKAHRLDPSGSRFLPVSLMGK